MVSMRIDFEYFDTDRLITHVYDSTEFDLEDGSNTSITIDLMNLWTDFVLENNFVTPIITGIEVVPYDGE